ncbi:hypothetical protein [Enterococcus pallens]|mgnify:CR=1 FL=1|uniref:Uncharacterized protein n=1 Tax=Enterococcus pallens ATCC BAA-351 TaxID=1158607 RepID=R2SDX3_9ENTE|nr:hypothetical protein [Enterococcus pallens]EOH91061.1 hypothetical protein UAU_03600 [Enterococcus pallens ATCC BAA-351]EOU16258.1 hypothetical protein I588_03914 [Enterococcus pallens ATCC BAA-351]OJG79000.1 hypothetical protein RV10_GL001123 [Enterococcus pallens]
MKELFAPKKEQPKESKLTLNELEKLKIELEAKSRLFATSIGLVKPNREYDFG